jgi:hypothetical protein
MSECTFCGSRRGEDCGEMPGAPYHGGLCPQDGRVVASGPPVALDHHTRLIVAMHDLRWTTQALADVSENSSSTVRRWRSGRFPVPAEILAWIERLAELARDCPPPPRSVWPPE